MIHILDAVTANGIAAGEVIERPASVVKELLENALDAGASRIAVEIVQGGIKRIRLVDNGSGMEPADAKLAFARHATSKLSRLEDLDRLQSMGFRGEALASIAAVSRVSLLTRTAEQDQGYFLRLEAGEILEEGPKAANIGSIFEVQDLFYNTPARYKFLKRDATEAAYVQDLVERFTFSRPDVAFSLMKDGTQSFVSPGDGQLLSAIYTVWGSESAGAALPIDHEFSGIKLQGYISKSSHSRKNRGRQVFLVNGRIIQSPLMRLAVDKAIQGHFVKGHFPELVLKLDLPSTQVDVNVHPQKTEVRFADENSIFRAVYHTLQDCLASHTGFKDIGQLTSTGPQAAPHLESKASARKGESSLDSRDGTIDNPSEGQTSSPGHNGDNHAILSRRNYQVTGPDHDGSIAQVTSQNSRQIALNLEEEISAGPIREAKQTTSPLASGQAYQERLKPEEQALFFAETESLDVSASDQDKLSPDLQALASARIIGQVFNTYLLLESGPDLLMIDQHAAHERILYEQLRADRRSSSLRIPSQPLLQPLSLKFSPLELSHALDQADEIRKMGFDFEEFGQDCLVLRALPVEFSHAGLNPERVFRAIIEEAGQTRLDEEGRLDEILHTTACKAAVKAHDILSFNEMKQLIHDLLKLEDPFHCPHGRPVILRLSAKDIEKFFNRIV
ncbi:MAG: DNA mismatch repair endonuclease MutL [Eubacteriales bacterium]|nr:DNA mismatch repair endonuclease MutL [Clostridiales bacterium]MDY5836135.1 DNA mismatch repair endonuclease MutL [Eubacteriales bacterium]